MSTIERADSDIQQDVNETLGSVGLPLTASVSQGVVKLEGAVLSEEEREAAVDLVQYIAGVSDVEDALEVMDIEDDQPNVLFGMPTRPDDWGANPDEYGEDSVIEGSVTTYDAGRTHDEWTTDERVAVEEGVSYMPPTDPPVEISADPDGIEVASGFQATSMDEEGALEPDEDLQGHDDVRDSEIIDNVVRELNEDAATTHLNIHVASVRGTVYLTGYVSDPADGDLAASVAERISGVRQVVERLVVGKRPVVTRRPPVSGAASSRRGQVGEASAAWKSTVARNEHWLAAELGKVTGQIKDRKEEMASFGRDQADEGSVTNHHGDIASDVTSAETLNTEIVNLEDEVDAIHEAQRMIDDGRYGICITCNQLIDPARLRAFPLAVRCITCQQNFEDQAAPPMQAGQQRGIG